MGERKVMNRLAYVGIAIFVILVMSGLYLGLEAIRTAQPLVSASPISSSGRTFSLDQLFYGIHSDGLRFAGFITDNIGAYPVPTMVVNLMGVDGNGVVGARSLYVPLLRSGTTFFLMGQTFTVIGLEPK
jgi:hypothetical protein